MWCNGEYCIICDDVFAGDRSTSEPGVYFWGEVLPNGRWSSTWGLHKVRLLCFPIVFYVRFMMFGCYYKNLVNLEMSEHRLIVEHWYLHQNYDDYVYETYQN